MPVLLCRPSTLFVVHIVAADGGSAGRESLVMPRQQPQRERDNDAPQPLDQECHLFLQPHSPTRA